MWYYVKYQAEGSAYHYVTFIKYQNALQLIFNFCEQYIFIYIVNIYIYIPGIGSCGNTSLMVNIPIDALPLWRATAANCMQALSIVRQRTETQ